MHREYYAMRNMQTFTGAVAGVVEVYIEVFGLPVHHEATTYFIASKWGL